jgi:hypothetical protein
LDTTPTITGPIARLRAMFTVKVLDHMIDYSV